MAVVIFNELDIARFKQMPFCSFCAREIRPESFVVFYSLCCDGVGDPITLVMHTDSAIDLGRDLWADGSRGSVIARAARQLDRPWRLPAA